MLHAVIMAGGSGTRFWPESRDARPKQLLNLTGERTMIQATVDRLGDLVGPQRVLIATNSRLSALMREQLPSLPPCAFLVTPSNPLTPPSICISPLYISLNTPSS